MLTYARKIGLEEHFAIAETLHDSAGFLPEDDWAELKPRLLDHARRRLRQMDDHGIEMMLLSLNAPAVQAISDRARPRALAARKRHSCASRCRNGQPASRVSPHCRCRTPILPSGSSTAASAISVSRARWSTASRRSPPRHRRLLRPAAVPAVLVPGGAARRTFLSASAQSAEGMRRSMRAHPWLMGPTGPSDRKPRCMRCA